MIKNSNVTNYPHDLFLFSGGVDSISLLEQLIHRKLTEKLLLVYVAIENTNLKKAEKELVAIKRCLSKLKSLYEDRDITYDFRQVTVSKATNVKDFDGELIPTVIYKGLDLATTYRSKRLFVGLVKGDCSLAPRTFDKSREFSGNYLTPIHAPLADTTKASAMIHSNPSLTKLASVCETYSNKRYCGICNKCIELYTAIHRVNFAYNIEDIMCAKKKRGDSLPMVIKHLKLRRGEGFRNLDSLNLSFKLV